LSNTPTESIMSRNPITCSQADPMSMAAKQMWEHDIGALPVVDEGGRVVGIITDRDIAMAAYTQGQPLDRMEVRSAMSRSPVTVRPQSPLTAVEALMQEHQIRRIAVVDDDGRAIGMVSLNDLARRTGPSRGAPVSREELTQTLRAVCQPRGAGPSAHAMA